MHLGARVPNEGARRLAWYLGITREAGWATVAKAMQTDVTQVDRLLSGELVPSGAVGYAISKATGHAVVAGDWWKPADGGWFDRPAPRFYTGFAPLRMAA